MKGRPLSTNLAVTIYLLVAVIWILSTDYILFQAFGENIRVYKYLQSFKGIAFILLSATAFYFISRRNNNFFKKNYADFVFSNKELSTILSETELGTARFGADGKFLYANPFFCKLIQYDLHEVINEHYSLIIKAEDNAELEYWDMMLKQGKLDRMKNLIGITTKTHRKLICKASVNEIKDAAGKGIYILILEDITDKVEENKKLEESLTRYTILSKSSMEGLWDWNILTGQLYYNSNIKQIMGYNDDELSKGYEWWKSNIHPDDKGRILEKMNEILHPGNIKATSNEYRFACKDGTYKIISDLCSVIRNEEGQPVRIIVSMQDVTEQRSLQQQLADKEITYRRQLARTVMDTQENERRKLAEELHDNVNQLLGVVKLYIEHSITNEKIRDGLLKKSNEYIDRVIEELRNLSKNLSPPLLAELGLEHSLVSMAEAIEEVQHVNISVDVENVNEDLLTESHKLMLYRIVQEQLNNIMKHAQAQNAAIRIEQRGNRVTLTITDDGNGTDLTLDNAQGQGLRNIRNRIELYQGNMEISTVPGKGFLLKVEFEI